MASLENAKKVAGFAAVDNHLKNGDKVGIGSGATIKYSIQRIREKKLNIRCCAINFDSKQLILENGLPLTDLEESPELDVTIDGADQIDVNAKNLIIGGGCAAGTQFKIVANASKKVVIIADFSKRVEKLGKPMKDIPIEVIPMAYKCVAKNIEKHFGGTTQLRMAIKKAGPIITENNNFIIDWKFGEDISDWKEVHKSIKAMSGVVETGILADGMDGIDLTVYLGREDGKLQTL